MNISQLQSLMTMFNTLVPPADLNAIETLEAVKLPYNVSADDLRMLIDNVKDEEPCAKLQNRSLSTPPEIKGVSPSCLMYHEAMVAIYQGIKENPTEALMRYYADRWKRHYVLYERHRLCAIAQGAGPLRGHSLYVYRAATIEHHLSSVWISADVAPNGFLIPSSVSKYNFTRSISVHTTLRYIGDSVAGCARYHPIDKSGADVPFPDLEFYVNDDFSRFYYRESKDFAARLVQLIEQ